MYRVRKKELSDMVNKDNRAQEERMLGSMKKIIREREVWQEDANVIRKGGIRKSLAEGAHKSTWLGGVLRGSRENQIWPFEQQECCRERGRRNS